MAKDEILFYSPWAVMLENKSEGIKQIIFPDFDEQPPLIFKDDYCHLKIIDRLVQKFHFLIEDRIEHKIKLNIPVSIEILEKIYGPEREGVSFTSPNFEIWKHINKVYPPAKDNTNSTPKSSIPLDLNFWAAISKPLEKDNIEPNGKGQFRYEVQFPEIEEDTARIFYARPLYEDIAEEVDRLLLYAMKDYLTKQEDLPYKILRQNAASICREFDALIHRPLDFDHYLDVISDTAVKKTSKNNLFERILKPF